MQWGWVHLQDAAGLWCTITTEQLPLLSAAHTVHTTGQAMAYITHLGSELAHLPIPLRVRVEQRTAAHSSSAAVAAVYDDDGHPPGACRHGCILANEHSLCMLLVYL